jgi:hypothetical protein
MGELDKKASGIKTFDDVLTPLIDLQVSRLKKYKQEQFKHTKEFEVSENTKEKLVEVFEDYTQNVLKEVAALNTAGTMDSKDIGTALAFLGNGENGLLLLARCLLAKGLFAEYGKKEEQENNEDDIDKDLRDFYND